MKHAVILGFFLWIPIVHPFPASVLPLTHQVEPTCWNTVQSRFSDGWNNTYFSWPDCNHAAHEFNEDIGEYDLFEQYIFTSIKNRLSSPGKFSSSQDGRLNTVNASSIVSSGLISLPLRWSFRSCSIVIQTREVYDDPAVPDKRNILRKGPRELLKYDVDSFTDMRINGLQSLHQCYSSMEVPGWTITGKKGAIGIFVWQTDSPMDKFTGPAVPLPPPPTAKPDLT